MRPSLKRTCAEIASTHANLRISDMASKLGEKLKILRKKKELTLDALAAEAGLSKSYLWELENRESLRPSAEKLQSIATVLGVDMAFFLDDSIMAPAQEHLGACAAEGVTSARRLDRFGACP